jgi:hypothetical protein
MQNFVQGSCKKVEQKIVQAHRNKSLKTTNILHFWYELFYQIVSGTICNFSLKTEFFSANEVLQLSIALDHQVINIFIP